MYVVSFYKIMGESNPKLRMAICNSCEHIEKKFLTPSKCAICGCALKLKTLIVSEECPLHKW